jgi:hypothetical protein
MKSPSSKRAAKSVVGHRHHRTRHLRRQGVLRRCLGHFLAAGRRMVYRFEAAATLVTNDLGMAIADRDPQAGVIVYSDHGV